MEFTLNGITYRFFEARMNGVEVIAYTWNNGTESGTEWSAEAIGLPRDEDEVSEYLEDFDWETVDHTDDFTAADNTADDREYFTLYYQGTPCKCWISAPKLVSDIEGKLYAQGYLFDGVEHRTIRVYMDAPKGLTPEE